MCDTLNLVAAKIAVSVGEPLIFHRVYVDVFQAMLFFGPICCSI